MSILEEIAAERRRQIEHKGYNAAHDDAHADGSIAKAASAYAAASVFSGTGAMLWPWRVAEFHPRGARDSLIKAAALCVAEIERLDRKAISMVECDQCDGSGFDTPGTGYGNVCGKCGGMKYLPSH